MNRNNLIYKQLFVLVTVLMSVISLFSYVKSFQRPINTIPGLAALPGNCNTDLVVNVQDYVLMSGTFLKVPGDAGYNAACNFNSQAIVDLSDYAILSANFGRTDTASATLTPIQQPGTNATQTVIAAGDIACGPDTRAGSPCREWATSEIVRQQNPNALFALGDLQYEGGQYTYFSGNNAFCRSNPSRCYESTWGRFKAITYPVVGNHEYSQPGAAGYFDYFNGTGNQTGRAGDRSKGYYSVNIGNWHVVVLNSNCAKVAGGCGPTSSQVNWLKQDLAQNNRSCTLAMMHHARFSSGHDGNNSTITAPLQPLWQALYDANVDVVLGGHSHNYERFALQNPNGQLDNTQGIQQFVVGTGGRDFTGRAWNASNSQIWQNNTFGVLKLTLKSTSYDWQFLPIAGSSWTDSGTASCH